MSSSIHKEKSPLRMATRRSRRGALAAALAVLGWPLAVEAQGSGVGTRSRMDPGSLVAPATAVVGARAIRNTADAGTPAKKNPTGRVVGMLTDAATGEALIGGQVGVQGLPLGNVSDDSGAYFINNVPVGKQTFTVEYLGYESQARQYDVKPGASNTLDFALTATAIEMAEIVVEEENVTDLSDRLENAPPPKLKPPVVKEIEAAQSDTTLMEEWHRSMRDLDTMHSIDYELAGTRVYFRKAPQRRARPEAAAPDADAPAAEGGATPTPKPKGP